MTQKFLEGLAVALGILVGIFGTLAMLWVAWMLFIDWWF